MHRKDKRGLREGVRGLYKEETIQSKRRKGSYTCFSLTRMPKRVNRNISSENYMEMQSEGEQGSYTVHKDMY